MGKDNASFHCVFFPSMLLGTGQKFLTVNNISTTEYLLFEGGKFSKSRGIGIFGPEMKNFGLHPDIWRFYLLMRRPETSDSSFDWKDLESTTNSLLVDQFGNLALRLQTLYYRHCCCNEPGGELFQSITCNEALLNDCFDFSLIQNFVYSMEHFHYRRAMEMIIQFVANINKYITNNEPWKLLKTDFPKAMEIICFALAGLLQATVCFHPFIPEKSVECLQWFGLLGDENSAKSIRIQSGWNLILSLQRNCDFCPSSPSALFAKISL
jgi:methionyl-tRNA synthetase